MIIVLLYHYGFISGHADLELILRNMSTDGQNMLCLLYIIGIWIANMVMVRSIRTFTYREIFHVCKKIYTGEMLRSLRQQHGEKYSMANSAIASMPQGFK